MDDMASNNISTYTVSYTDFSNENLFALSTNAVLAT